ncbi:MAG: PPOX class F420-dependent oxidoreductase [Mycobacteriaceae bacterium]
MAQKRKTPQALNSLALSFLSERHLGTLVTIRLDGTPHLVAVGFTWDEENDLVRIITHAASQKVKNVLRAERVAVNQVDGARWLTLEGKATVKNDTFSIDKGVQLYAKRFREPRVNPDRVVIEILVDRVLGSASLFH